MMLPDQILDAANRAYHDNRIGDWRAWHSLLHLLGYLAIDSQIVALTQLEQEERERRPARLARDRADDVQFDYKREAEREGVNITELLR